MSPASLFLKFFLCIGAIIDKEISSLNEMENILIKVDGIVLYICDVGNGFSSCLEAVANSSSWMM